MNDEPLNARDFEVFAHYGVTMAAVQRFELAMSQLARLLHPQLHEATHYEQAWKWVEKHLKKPEGSPAKQLDALGYPPQKVLERIRQLMGTRKNLAHEILLRYMIERDAGVLDQAWMVSSFAEVEEDFWAWGNLFGELYETLAGERSVTPQELDSPLTGVRESFEQEDTQLLFSTYGCAMYAVQRWEYALKSLLIYLDLPGDDEDVSFDEAWEPVARTLMTAAGPLRKRLEEQGYSPQGLHEQLETFRNRRNELAHKFFLDFDRVLKAGDPEAHGAALKFLEAMRLFFEEQTDILDALSDEEVDKRDWDLDDLGGLTEEELWRIELEDEEAGEES